MLVHVFEYDKPLTVYGMVVYDYTRHFILYDPDAACFFLQTEMLSRNAQLQMMQRGMDLPRRILHFVHIDCHDWVKAEENVAAALSDFCTRTPSPPWIAGYPDAISNTDLLRRLLEGETVLYTDAGILLRTVPARDEWYELTTQNEADIFLWIMSFHDAHIDQVIYSEPKYRPHEVSVRFDLSEWNGCRVEYCFEEPTVAHITNGRYPNGRDILSAILYIDESGVFWADKYLDKEAIDEPFDPEITYIRAKRVKVRRID